MPPRNAFFKPEREPFSDNDDLELQKSHVSGPLSFLNPTSARFHHTGIESDSGRRTDVEDTSAAGDATHSPDISFLWRSRDNRKGRHVMQVHQPASGDDVQHDTPASTSSPRAVGRNILTMLTKFPVWDISWDIAFIFTLGSAVWVINSFFAFLPLVQPSTAFPGELLDGGGVTAFLGAIIFFETGSILLFFEAINENHDGCFGWAVEQMVGGDEEAKGSRVRVKADRDHCSHHHRNRHNFVGSGVNESKADTSKADASKADTSKTDSGKSWQWFPSWHDLRTHYMHELGFIAGCLQITGASIFGISGFTALPGVQNHLYPQRVLNGVYWVPQIVGGSFFIMSGSLYMLETQKKWYRPAFGVLGWHIGFWNTIGGIGFTLCGALGPSSAYVSGCAYQSSLATFWGSWAFLIGSVFQWYEASSKYSVEVVPAEDSAGKSAQ